jgi:hypothetical protein
LYPSIDTVTKYGYPYWTVEYLYTAGKPAQHSLEAGFLSYMYTNPEAGNVLLGNLYTPCVDQEQKQNPCATRHKSQ